MTSTSAEPLRESSVLLLVRALAAAGDRARALAAFDEYRDCLAAGTGLEPTPRVREVRQRIRACQPGEPVPSQTRPARPDGSCPGRRTPFLGREEECAVIADAVAGYGHRVVLVTGPSGIGQSALRAAAALRAAVPVLSVQAFAPDQDQPWSLAARLLGQAARRCRAGGGGAGGAGGQRAGRGGAGPRGAARYSTRQPG